MILLLSEKLTRNIEKHALLSAVLFVLFIWYARSSFEDNFVTFVVRTISYVEFEDGAGCVPRVLCRAQLDPMRRLGLSDNRHFAISIR